MGYHCDKCHPELGASPLCDGLPSWCAQHWYETLCQFFGDPQQLVEGDYALLKSFYSDTARPDDPN